MHATKQSSRSFLRSAISLTVLAALALRPVAARAENSLEQELAELAKGVKQLLDGRRETALQIGQFVPHGLPASAGPAIARTLAEELKKAGIDVKLRARFTLKGSYTAEIDDKSGLLIVRLETKIVDDKGKTITGLKLLAPRGIFGNETVAVLFGLTVDLPPGDDDKARDDRLRSSLNNPQANLKSTRIQAGNQPFAIEILVKSGADYKPRAAEEREGLAFVKINRDEVYAVRVFNDAEHKAAVTLTVDGFNMFTFSDLRDPKSGKPLYQQFLLRPHRHFDIKGWHKNNKLSNEFFVTSYDKSAVAELQSSANLGTITVSFAAAWPENGQPPADESPNPSKFSRSAGDATGRGKAFTQKYDEVRRQFGVNRTIISVRYDR